jgi:hypothetical protein
VYRKHPPSDPRSSTGQKHVRRNIRETTTTGKNHNNNKKKGGMHQKHKKPTPKSSYIGNKIYDSAGQVPSTRTGSRPEKLKNGKYIEYHPSVNYGETVLSQFPDRQDERRSCDVQST